MEKIIIKTETEISIRDYFKDKATELSSTRELLKQIKNEFNARSGPLKIREREIIKEIKKIDITPAIIEELQQDKNAYNLIKNVFPEIFKE